MKKHKKMFSLFDAYQDRVKVVGLVVKDAVVGKDDKAAILFISLNYDNKLIEAQIALDETPDFKNHIISIIDQAAALKDKPKKK